MQLLHDLKKQILIIDGAMGTMVQNAGLTDQEYGGAEFNMLADLLAFSRPDVLKGIHLQYLQAGANIIETNTFGASGLRLKEYDFSRLDVSLFRGISAGLDITRISHDAFAYHLNKKAVEVAQSAVTDYRESLSDKSKPLYVAGCIGPSNWVLSSTRADLKRGTYAQIMNNFYHQVLGLIDGGVDVLCFDTAQDQLELKAGVHGAQQAMSERNKKIPIIAHVTVDQFGKMQIFNTDIFAALVTLQDIGIDVFGINCSIGPDLMENTIRILSERSKIPVSIMPNAGLPENEDGKTVFKLGPAAFAAKVREYAEKYALNIVGGCCGTTPKHIEAVALALQDLSPKIRKEQKIIYVSGPQNAVALDSTQGLIRIGERLNVRGSKQVREAVERDGEINFDAIEEVVNEQIKDLGIEIIDVCMDSNLVNTEESLVKVIREVATDFSGAMCLDSFSVEALLQAIEAYPGRPIINSISLEEYSPGLDKLDAIVGKTYQHSPIYIALCTSATGPAQTAEEKFQLAKRIYEKCHEKYGVTAGQLLVDMNAFPIGSESIEGMNFSKESIDAVALIKTIHPDIGVSIGVGNLTNGLASKPYMRKVITSVFLGLAREKGLDAAIVNPHHYVPVESLPTQDVELARRVILDHDMDAFATLEEIAIAKKGTKILKKISYDEMTVEDAICQKIKDGYKNRVKGNVHLDGLDYEYQDTLVIQVAQALKTHDPLDFVNHYLMKSMRELGEGFGRGEVSLPHLLKSADVMKAAMGFIEAFIHHKSGKSAGEQIKYKGTVVLGTVYQDVHSIGKDLTKTLLENYGYRVIDMGVQTPLESFVKVAKEQKAVAVGMSALLVQTSVHMITVARMLADAGMHDMNILIGGAPVNQRHAAYVSMHGQKDVSKILPHVFYCSTGMDGVNVLNQLLTKSRNRDELCEKNIQELKWQYAHAQKQLIKDAELLKTLPRRQVSFAGVDDRDLLSPLKLQMSMREFAPHLDVKTLFSLNWRYGGKSSWAKKGVDEQALMKQLGEWIANCDTQQWIIPQCVCAIFPCHSEGDEVVVLDQQHGNKQIARIKFTVVVGAGKNDVFSAAQYFQTKNAGVTDRIGLQISTAGPLVDQQIQKFKDSGDTESALFLQGLSDRVAEDMAGYAHHYLLQKMGLDHKTGTRYSPGYPGLADLSVNQTISDLLHAERELGISLTEVSEFYPTGTTGAVVCFHPDARYD